MASVNITLSKRDGGVLVMPLTKARYDDQREMEPTSASQVPDIHADHDHGNALIWEISSDVDIRVMFGEDPVVTMATGRRLFAGIPYTFGAERGQKVAVILAT